MELRQLTTNTRLPRQAFPRLDLPRQPFFFLVGSPIVPLTQP